MYYVTMSSLQILPAATSKPNLGKPPLASSTSTTKNIPNTWVHRHHANYQRPGDQTPKQCYGRLQQPEPDLRLPASRCDGILELNLNVNSDDFVCPSKWDPIRYSASHPKSNSSVHQPICFWLGCQDHRSLGHYLLRVHVCVSVFRWYVEGGEECLESKYCGFEWFSAHLMISPPITHRSPKAAAQGLAAPKVVQGHAPRVASGAKGGIYKYIASIQRYVCRQGEVQLYTVYHSMTRTNRSM